MRLWMMLCVFAAGAAHAADMTALRYVDQDPGDPPYLTRILLTPVQQDKITRVFAAIHAHKVWRHEDARERGRRARILVHVAQRNHVCGMGRAHAQQAQQQPTQHHSSPLFKSA